MKFIEQIINEIKNGENVENYLIILAAFVIVGMDILGLGNGEWYSEVILGVLALLAYGRITDHRKLNRISHAISSSISNEKFLKNSEYHANRPRIQHAKTLDFMGLTLNRTLSIYEYAFTECLKNGGIVRLLIVDPKSPIPDALAAMGYSKGSKDQILSNISATLGTVKNWQKTIPNCNVEVKLLVGFPAARMAVFDKGEANGYVTVRLFMLPRTKEIPMNVLRASENPEWFELFSDQFERHWEMARVPEQ